MVQAQFAVFQKIKHIALDISFQLSGAPGALQASVLPSCLPLYLLFPYFAGCHGTACIIPLYRRNGSRKAQSFIFSLQILNGK